MRSLLLSLVGATLALAPMRAPDLPAQILPVYGGTGGTAFSRSCGAGKVLTGMRYREGMVVDAVGLLCRAVNANGSLGTESSVGTMAGGSGGTFGVASCPAGTVVAGAKLYYGSFIDGVILSCAGWAPLSRTFGAIGAVRSFGKTSVATKGEARCESSAQPVVAIRGREASVVDALGVTCNEP
jgi:hypothetical protein